MKKAVFAVLMVLQGMVATQAFASVTHVFELFGDDENGVVLESFALTEGSLNVSVSAWTASYNNNHRERQAWSRVEGNGVGVFQDDDGLGVVSSDDDGETLDGGRHRDRATDPDEGLLFVFSRAVSLDSMFVSSWGSNDDVNYSLVEFVTQDQIQLTDSVYDEGRPGNDRFDLLVFNPGFVGTAFMIWVDGRSDDVQLFDLEVTVVPAPGALAVLLLGLGAMAVYRRKA